MAQLEARSEPKARADRSDDHKADRPDQSAITDPDWINPERAPHSQAAMKMKTQKQAKSAAHDPGPWHVESRGGLRYIATQRLYPIARLFVTPNEKANARLLAAAPDGYEAVKAALVFPQPPLVEKALRAFVAKVEGLALWEGRE